MSELSSKDIEIFGKVLSEFGKIIEDNPNEILNLIKTIEPKRKVSKLEISKEVEGVNVFLDFKDKKKNEIINSLSTFNKGELKFLIKKFQLGTTRLNSAERLSEFISDQVIKRTTDVFIKQE